MRSTLGERKAVPFILKNEQTQSKLNNIFRLRVNQTSWVASKKSRQKCLSRVCSWTLSNWKELLIEQRHTWQKKCLRSRTYSESLHQRFMAVGWAWSDLREKINASDRHWGPWRFRWRSKSRHEDILSCCTTFNHFYIQQCRKYWLDCSPNFESCLESC